MEVIRYGFCIGSMNIIHKLWTGLFADGVLVQTDTV